MSEPQTTQPAPPPHLSPKDQFLADEQRASAWRNLMRQSTVHTGLTLALAEFCYSTPEPSADQIRAVKIFIEIALNLAEPKSPPRSGFPDKRLSSTPPATEPPKK